jgi:hypothetical protein
MGCGPQEDYVYNEGCVTIHSEIELVPWKVGLYTQFAEEMYDARFGSGQFCYLVSGIPRIDVVDVITIPCGVQQCGGITGPFGHISLAKDGEAFLHETLHVRDIYLGNIDTMFHGNWTKNGYYDMDLEFRRAIRELGHWLRP